MMRFLGVSFLLILTIVASYTVFALRGDDSTSVTVKIFGPGNTPSECEERLRPHFNRMEPAMTAIAEALLESEDNYEVAFGFDKNDNIWLYINSGYDYRKASKEEAAFFVPKFQAVRKGGYYAPYAFEEEDNQVFSITTGNCGVPFIEWVRLQLGIGWSEGSIRLPVAHTAYIYDPEGVKEIDPCPDVVIDPDPTIYCQIQLNENWMWVLEYFDYEQLQELWESRQRESVGDR